MNSELRDFEMDARTARPGGGGGEAPPPRWPWLVALLLVIAGVVAFFWFRADEAAEEPVAAAQPAVAPAPREDEPSRELVLGTVPDLDESDTWLQGVIEQISSHPQLAEWLLTPELIRKFVVTVDNIAEGVSPRKHLQVMAPETKLSVVERNGKLYLDPASYDRYDLLIDVVTSLDSEGAAELYRAIEPLLQDAYDDLGYAGIDFDLTLARAINNLLDAPVLEGPIELEKRVTGYRFASSELEDLAPATKQFLRLGPENLSRLQDKVRELARAVDLRGVS